MGIKTLAEGFVKFSIPYIKGLYQYLVDSENYRDVSDVYFSDSKRFPLARGVSVLCNDDIAELSTIRELGINLNYTLNPAIYPVAVYTDPPIYIKILEELFEIGVGMLTISSPYILKMDEYKEVLSKFTIRCSAINSVQTLEQVRFWEKHLDLRHFVLYGMILRNFDEIERIALYSKKNGITLTLLVNEHCHPTCPYRMNEFSWGVLCSTPESKQSIHLSGMDVYGCRELLHVPEEHMKMLGIGPNRVTFFDEYVDNFKLINRDVRLEQMKVVLDSYIGGVGSVTLKDTIPKMCPSWYSLVTWNELYSYGFFENTLNCRYRCFDCSRCSSIFETYIAPKVEKRRIETSACFISLRLCKDCKNWKKLRTDSEIKGVSNGFCSSRCATVSSVHSCENFF